MNPSPGIAELLAAARDGRVADIESLITTGVEKNATDEDGESALHRAVRHFQDNAVRCLLARGCDITLRDRYGTTPMLRAAMDGNLAAMLMLQDAGGSLTESDPDGRTPLIWASIRNRKVLLPHLTAYLAQEALNASARSGRTALMEAALRGGIAFVEMLLQSGADVDALDSEGSTALHWALRKRQSAAAMLLIGKTQRYNRLNRAGFTPLIIAVRNNMLECTGALLARGADICGTDNQGNTALFWALRKGHDEIALLLRGEMGNMNRTAAEGGSRLGGAFICGR